MAKRPYLKGWEEARLQWDLTDDAVLEEGMAE